MKKQTLVLLAVGAGVAAWLWSRRKKPDAVAPKGPVGVVTVGELTVTDWHPAPTPAPNARYFVAL